MSQPDKRRENLPHSGAGAGKKRCNIATVDKIQFAPQKAARFLDNRFGQFGRSRMNLPARRNGQNRHIERLYSACRITRDAFGFFAPQLFFARRIKKSPKTGESSGFPRGIGTD